MRKASNIEHELPGRAESKTVRICGLRIDNLTMREALDWIAQRLDGRGFHQVSFLNAACVNMALRDRDYRRVLAHSSLVLADGIGLRLAGRVLGRRIVENVNGTDLFPLLCERLRGSGKRIFLLGAGPGIAETMRRRIEDNPGGVIVCGATDGYFHPETERELVSRIARSGADLLLVALGAPHQEKWIARAASQTGVKVAIGVGGLFDFYSGRIPRAPQWLREHGLEWAYRLYHEPRRLWRRYLIGNPVFLWHILRRWWRHWSGWRLHHAGDHA
jgi:N-acetylglucosaminyldiphosphoundecaprenol N-acetyl-beta-D-mannosaminyltransferase